MTHRFHSVARKNSGSYFLKFFFCRVSFHHLSGVSPSSHLARQAPRRRQMRGGLAVLCGQSISSRIGILRGRVASIGFPGTFCHAARIVQVRLIIEGNREVLPPLPSHGQFLRKIRPALACSKQESRINRRLMHPKHIGQQQQRSREEHRPQENAHRQRQHPRQQQVPQRVHLQP